MLIQHVAGEQPEGKPERLKPRAGEPMSRSASELDSASLRTLGSASPPTRMKPATGREAMSQHLSGSSGWLGAARGDRFVEEPGKPSWAVKNQREAGTNNRERPRGWRRGP